MNKQHGRLALISLIALLTFVACQIVSVEPSLPAAPGMPETLAAQTWSAMQTSAALSATATNTAAPATNTPLPTDTPTITLTPTPTETPVPMLTAIPTRTPEPTSTPTLIPTITPYYVYPGTGGGSVIIPGSGGTGSSSKTCLAAKLVRDLTIPSGEVLPPNQNFVKVWRIQNTGICTWDSSIYFTPVTFINGFPYSDPLFGLPIQIDQKVKPGKTIDLAVSLSTPNREGTIKSQWVFTDGEEIFGNKGTDTPFVVNVNVRSSAPYPLFDFVSSACLAYWQSNARVARNGKIRIDQGVSNLACGGKTGNPLGFIRRLNNPKTEAGTISGVTGLWEQPPFATGGIIQGVFPAILVLGGDQFTTQVGCMDGYDQCDVTFELRYRTIVPPYTVTSENSVTRDEVYDGTLGSINLDLSSLGLAGQYVEFSLSVRANNDTKENAAVWVAPYITH